MTQVFADDDQASATAFVGLPTQRVALSPSTEQRPIWSGTPSRDLAPAMMAGKGVRAVTCVGCRRETLPRTDDGAPLCARCCEVLAGSSRVRLPVPERWWRRRSRLA